MSNGLSKTDITKGEVRLKEKSDEWIKDFGDIMLCNNWR